MKFIKNFLSLFLLLLFCITQAGCAIIQIPVDILGTVVSTAVSAGLAYGPSVAPFFM
jgi:hypothetical protein